jgi:hypothetical protein
MAAEFYVYALIDPRNNKPFYIGKGKGNRCQAHVKEARKGGESPKCCAIREIESAGLSVEAQILKRFACEDAAYKYEARLIKRIGVENLTNLAPGGRCLWPIKPDTQRERDEAIVTICRKAAIVRRAGMVPAIRFAGQLFDIPTSLLEKTATWFLEIKERRGPAWLLKRGVVCVD